MITSRSRPRRAPSARSGGSAISIALLLSLEQLDHVAEQDELLDSLERIQQSSQWLGASEHIAPQTRAEVEI
jgi:hypothetical protein